MPYYIVVEESLVLSLGIALGPYCKNCCYDKWYVFADSVTKLFATSKLLRYMRGGMEGERERGREGGKAGSHLRVVRNFPHLFFINTRLEKSVNEGQLCGVSALPTGSHDALYGRLHDSEVLLEVFLSLCVRAVGRSVGYAQL